MNKKLSQWIFGLISLFLAAALALPVSAVGSSKTEESAQDLIEQIIIYEEKQAEVEDAQSLLDVGLVPFAGTSPTDWLVINLTKSGLKINAEKYLAALEDYIKQPENTAAMKATDYERIGLCFAAFGRNKAWIETVIDTQTGAYGIMSEIYGLILYQTGTYQTTLSGTTIAEMILDRQMDCGGFGLSANIPDADVTAMALQALAPYAEQYGTQIEKALDFLSAVQSGNGGYQSFGTENVESTAQVLMALCALGIDYKTDTRFIKGGNNLYYVIKTYHCDDGGFSHIPGGKSNQIATYQVWSALLQICGQTAQEPELQPEQPTKHPTVQEQPSLAEESTTEAETESGGTTSKEPEQQTGSQTEQEQPSLPEEKPARPSKITGKQIKFFGIAVVIAAALGILISLLIRKKFRWYYGLILAAAAVGLVLFLWFARIETAEEHYAQGENALLDGTYGTTLSIQGFDRVILPETTVMLDDGDTAFDQLYKAVTAHGINLGYSGSAMLQNVYIQSIDGLSEFDYGDRSGWMYTVNGIYPQVGAAAYVLQEDDVVVWIYTDGRDLL